MRLNKCILESCMYTFTATLLNLSVFFYPESPTLPEYAFIIFIYCNHSSNYNTFYGRF